MMGEARGRNKDLDAEERRGYVVVELFTEVILNGSYVTTDIFDLRKT